MSEKLYKCECCDREFDEEEYQMTLDKNKCIFHCEKDSWITIINSEEDEFNLGSEQQTYWDREKVKYFWEKFKNIVNEKGLTEKEYYYRFNNFIFPDMEMETFKKFQFSSDLVFDETCTFKGNVYFYESVFDKQVYINNCKIEANVFFIKSIFNDRFTFNNMKELKKVNFIFSEFNKKFQFKYSKNIELDLTNVVFNELADFNSTEFIETNFFKTSFKNVTVFTKATFRNYVDFKYTTFSKLGIFRDSTFENKLNLEDTIFKGEVNFLKVNTEVENRETARIIKNSFEQQNNIIEANKFYALEMKEREKELEKDLKNGKNILDWLIFKIHGITSNHSQNWEYSLFWIIIISLFYSYGFDFLSKKDEYINILHMNYQESFLYCIQTNKELYNFFKLTMWMMSPFIIVSFISNYSYKLLYFFLCIFLIVLYIYLTNDFTLSIVANNINPFSIITEKGSLGLAELLYRVSIAFLIYQLIVSIRQNTRRK